MPNNSAKIMQWKAGEEKDSKGFYWSTKLAVQQAWEQYNTVEEPQNHRTFRSTIHVTMIPIICFELMIDRATFDRIPDAELIDLLDRKLKPTGPAEYLIKLRQIRFNNDDRSGTLLHRYRAFAEPFLQLVAEATDAGCPINNESTKLAFKAACRGNELLMMFLQEDRWTTAATAHHRIMAQLRNFNSLQTMNSMNTSITQATPGQAVVMAPAQPHAHLPPQVPVPHPHAQHHPVKPNFHQPRQQTAMVNVMHQLLDRFERLDRSQASVVVPSPSPQQNATASYPAARVNVGQLNPAPNATPTFTSPRAPRVHDLTPHPGLDSRGPYWHPEGQQFQCRFKPCLAMFCQGCGRHGHTAAECVRRNAQGFNAFGYYADRYPNQGALMFPAPPPNPAPQLQQAPVSSTAFPTPHRINQSGGHPAAQPSSAPPPPPRYTPVVRSNVSMQTTPAEPPPLEAVPSQQ
jgi:hypothetical protein